MGNGFCFAHDPLPMLHYRLQTELRFVQPRTTIIFSLTYSSRQGYKLYSLINEKGAHRPQEAPLIILFKGFLQASLALLKADHIFTPFLVNPSVNLPTDLEIKTTMRFTRWVT